VDGELLKLRRIRPAAQPFAYTLEVPGTCTIPELALRFQLRRGPVASWMFRSSPRQVGLSLPLEAGSRVMVRSRRPGDRLRPLGCAYSRRLKEVLIDRRVSRHERDRLPLLLVNSRVAWVPGVTIAEDFKLRQEESAWIAQLDPL
jgi:tRNA(Ile)-lysidine synthase